MLCNSNVIVVFLRGLVTEHLWKDVLVESTETFPVVGKNMLVVISILLAHVLLHLWKLILVDVLTQVKSNHFLVHGRCLVEELRAG